MTQSRQALRISIVYSIPLLLWFSAQLQFIDWNSLELARFFNQALTALILLQVFSLALLFTNRCQQKMQDELVAILFVMLYPMPFLAIIWLGGSASYAAPVYAVLIVATAGGIAFLIQCCLRTIPTEYRLVKLGLSAAQILPAIAIWNFRDLWQGLLDL